MNIHKHDGSKGKEDDSLPDKLSEDLETYRTSENSKVSLSQADVDAALNNVLSQLDNEMEESSDADVSFTFNWKLMAIAASVTFIGMLFFLSIPVKVEVPNGQLATVDLPDGTSITLNSGSELSYSRFYNYFNREVALSGEGYFEVQSDPENPFTVTTANSIVNVLGTKFNLSDWNESVNKPVTLTVTEGTVEFQEKNGSNNLILNENESAAISQFSGIISSSVEVGNVLAWLSKNISFQNESLVQAFRMIERRFDIVIEHENSFTLENENITAFYHDPKNPESIIQDICTIKGLSYQKTHNGFKIVSN